MVCVGGGTPWLAENLLGAPHDDGVSDIPYELGLFSSCISVLDNRLIRPYRTMIIRPTGLNLDPTWTRPNMELGTQVLAAQHNTTKLGFGSIYGFRNRRGTTIFSLKPLINNHIASFGVEQLIPGVGYGFFPRSHFFFR